MINKIKGCLFGVRIGDGLGFPFETMSLEEIKESVGTIETYHPPKQKIIGDTGRLPAGAFTDDWQLTKVVAESLISCGRFDITDQALHHVEAMNQSSIGWGKSTHQGIGRLRQYFESFGKKGSSPTDNMMEISSRNSDNSRGCGNGVAIKIAPLAIFTACSKDINIDKFVENVFALGNLTHNDPRASMAAVAVGLEIIRNFGINVNTIDIIKQYESNIANFDVSERLKFAAQLNEEDLYQKISPGFFALNSCIFAIEMAKRYNDNFKLAATSTLQYGGDCDSTAAMTLSIVGSALGKGAIPIEWLPEGNEIDALSDRLLEVIQHGRPGRFSGNIKRLG